MIKSMTGFGVAQLKTDKVSILVEVKSLNSKFLDANIKLPKSFFDKEIELRKLLGEKLERGKVSLSVNYFRKDEENPRVSFNQNLFKFYYTQLQKLAEESGANQDELLKICLQYPDVIQTEESKDMLKKEWKVLSECILEAIGKCDNYRSQEGKTLMKKLVVYIDRIEAFLGKIEKQDPARIQKIKERIQQHLEEISQKDQFDPNRFEQEMIYFIEKLDISEEKVRLKSHLEYFLDILNNESGQGKKLGFISQEIGREINTIGSKANDAQIQRHVVGMKEELEKIKEQLLNIL
ncbi:MAG: YicC/YloC family endoribonuclease [Cyclobacteriaceae bacterium]